jgi:hypothetical protein
MDFFIGMIVGMIVGCSVITSLGALMMGKRADRDYESEQNEPQGRRVDRQGR